MSFRQFLVVMKVAGSLSHFVFTLLKYYSSKIHSANVPISNTSGFEILSIYFSSLSLCCLSLSFLLILSIHRVFGTFGFAQYCIFGSFSSFHQHPDLNYRKMTSTISPFLFWRMMIHQIALLINGIFQSQAFYYFIDPNFCFLPKMRSLHF